MLQNMYDTSNYFRHYAPQKGDPHSTKRTTEVIAIASIRHRYVVLHELNYT